MSQLGHKRHFGAKVECPVLRWEQTQSLTLLRSLRRRPTDERGLKGAALAILFETDLARLMGQPVLWPSIVADGCKSMEANCSRGATNERW